MNAQRILLIVVVWTLLLAPAACLSGLIGHYCAPCSDVCNSHEIDCSEDPCNVQLLPSIKFRYDDQVSSKEILLVALSPLADILILLEIPGVYPVILPPGLPNLQTPVSDLPLLC